MYTVTFSDNEVITYPEYVVVAVEQNCTLTVVHQTSFVQYAPHAWVSVEKELAIKLQSSSTNGQGV